MSNFTIIKNGSVLIEAESINWVSQVKEDASIRQFETSPAVGYKLASDFTVASIYDIDLNNVDKASLKSTWSHMTDVITSIEEVSRESIRFTTGEDVYEVKVNNINTTPKPRTSPVSNQ